MLQLFLKVFLIGVAVNFPWEMAEAYLYAPMGDWVTATTRCFRAALADGAIVVGIAATGTAVFRRYDWIGELSATRLLFTVVTGGIVAILIEHYSLRAGRWDYGPLMPMIPGTRIGAFPILQMMILLILVFRLAARVTRRM